MFLEIQQPGKEPRALTLAEAVQALGPDAPSQLAVMGFDRETVEEAKRLLSRS